MTFSERIGESPRELDVERMERMRNDPLSDVPIAIVGMACRFPGANDIAEFWRFLEEGKNAVVEGLPGSGVGRVGALSSEAVDIPACRFGAFVDGIDLFDPAFFRISPIEAQFLDPQQRMMLEVSWQALEDAGIDPDSLKGSRTGVYVGISNIEYRGLIQESDDPAEPAATLYALTGSTLNGVSGRVSFVLGLEGPTLAIDAACSSSLVAVHQAISGLRQGEADLALAGGVQVILDGHLMKMRAIAGMLSSEGQCKTFDASADGYVRGEGCGVVVLKRLSDAEAAGDRIWGVIRGSAVNHGGTGAGLTVPNGPTQERVIEEALARAGVSPADVDYLEAHGTGTEVGDPIEVEAAAAVYGKGREPERPLLIGSVKTNIGHLEPAAGIAGLIKTLLAMHRGMIPKHLNLHNPNPRLDWERLPVRVPTEPAEWPQRPGHPLRAGVSSYGISGTNAHVVIESYGSHNATAEPRERHWVAGASKKVTGALAGQEAELQLTEQGLIPRKTRFLPLSGKSASALRELAGRYLTWLNERAGELASPADEDEALADMAWTAAVGRSHFPHRAGLLFRGTDTLTNRLNALVETDDRPQSGSPKKVAFAYTGQGSQWVGMGRELYQTEPVARAVFDRCEAVFLAERGKSLLDVVFGRAGNGEDLSDTAWEQPALFALACALTALWASVGVRPTVVLGHSVGELAASWAAGVFSLEDGMRLAATRGALLSGTGHGAMAAVFASAEKVVSAIESLNAESDGIGLSLAADNGTHQVVSGPAEKIEAISKRFETEEVRVTRLNTSRAFHSALLDPALEPLEAFLVSLTVKPPTRAALVSNLTGQSVGPEELLDGAYWRRHARQPVAFASGVKALAELGVDAVVEIGPHSVLGPMAAMCWPEQASGASAAPAPVILASLLRPARGETKPESGFAEAVAAAYEAGLEMSLKGLFTGEARRKVSLPSYPFQRTRHWVEAPKRRRASAGHPLLGVRHESPRGEQMFETEVSPSDPGWLADHQVFGRVVAPGAMYAAMAASALRSEGTDLVVIEDMQLHSPLILSDQGTDGEEEDPGRRLQLVMDATEGTQSRRVEIFSKGSEERWTRHMEGRISAGAGLPELGERVDLKNIKSGLSPEDVPAFYRAKSSSGIEFGPAFRGIQALWSGAGEALGDIALPPDVERNGIDFHPLLLDGCFQILAASRDAAVRGETTYLPFGWERLWLAGPLPERIACHVRLRGEAGKGRPDSEAGQPAETLTADLWIYASDGTPLGGLSGFSVKRATRAALLSAVEGLNDLFYEIVWRDRAPEYGVKPADFLASPSEIAGRVGTFASYMLAEGVEPGEMNGFFAGMELLTQSYSLSALEQLGWERKTGMTVKHEELRERLNILPRHGRLLKRMLELLTEAGILTAEGDSFVVSAGSRELLPEESLGNPEEFAARLGERYPHGWAELTLLRRCGEALPDVLQGSRDPLELLFSVGEPGVEELYRDAPVHRTWNRMLGDAVALAVSTLPNDRMLKVLEVGAGTGSATGAVLPKLPTGRFEYDFTDISAGFLADAESIFDGREERVDFRVLDMEADPVEQGFGAHGYDIVIASQVIHATRDLKTTLQHCLKLLAPSGQLVAHESLRVESWSDLVFGLLEGWWLFDDDYRTDHVMPGAEGWRRALVDAGFRDVEIVSSLGRGGITPSGRAVILAQGPATVAEPPGVWVLAADQAGLADEVAAELTAKNQTVVIAGEDAADGEGGLGVVKAFVEAGRRESWRSLVERLPGDAPLKGIVHLMGTDSHGVQASTGEFKEDVARAAGSALALVQGLLDADAAPALGTWFITRGAQVLERERAGALSGATLWGFGRVLAREATNLNPRLIDLDPAEPTLPPGFVDELLHPGSENQIAYRAGNRRVARLVRSGRQLPPDVPQPMRVRDDRTYLVTGGLGGIGCAVAGWLAEQGAGAIVLNGRRPPDPAAEEAIAALRQQGATVHVELADVADEAAVQAMLTRIDAALPPLGGLIHSVGQLLDASLTNQSWEGFEQILGPKVLGSWRLHRATEGRDLDLFILFSSFSGVTGRPGQANYAAANAFLDQLAAHRRSLGLPGQVVQWGAWSDLGEAEEHRERITGYLTAFGNGWMTPQQGISAFGRIVRQNAASTAVGIVDWQVLAADLPSPMPLIEELLPEVAGMGASASGPEDNLLSRLRGPMAAEREELLVSFLQGELQAALRLPSPPSPSVRFFDLGMDSLMAVNLRNRLNRALAGEYVVPNTIVFDYPDTASLARHLAKELAKVDGATPQSQRRVPVRCGADLQVDNGIAIVGMACRFPGAPDLPSFWTLLENSANAITGGRPDATRLNGINAEAAGDDAGRMGGYISGIDQFDASFFRMVPIEARNMDPQQRLLLETSWHALEDAGMDPERLRNSRTGVYAGISGSEYRDVARAAGSNIGLMANNGGMAVGRVAYELGLAGPAMPVELACASALAAVHQAVASLRLGEIDLALVGGVNAVLSPALTREMTLAGMLSPDGQCRTFDAGANGSVRGEGCGMVVLKRLSEAEADGDRIWGVIRGSAVNQNGVSAGPTAPNGPAQERVIQEALSRAGVSPKDVDYLEAHGVGSGLGDPIEVQAAAAVYGIEREAERPLLIGSVKTNIGHLESAAGVAALIKVVLAMKQGVIPKHLNFREPTHLLDWETLLVKVTSEAAAWPRNPGRPPLAGVSAFGMQGTNAHVIVEGYEIPSDGDGDGDMTRALWVAGSGRKVEVSLPEPLAYPPLPEEGLTTRETRLLPLSGKSDAALRELAARYLSWLEERVHGPLGDGSVASSLADLAWTASVGRSRFAHRAGIAFRDAGKLREGLKALTEAEGRPDRHEVAHEVSKVGFVYSGLGKWQVGAGRELYDTEPVARAVFERCDEVFVEETGASLIEVIFGSDGTEVGNIGMEWERPALYALECALTALWYSVGVRPAIVAGKDDGKLAAAQAAGLLSLEEGLRLAVSGAAPPILEGVPTGISSNESGVDLVVEISPGHGFTESVASVYEAGLNISFEGLFAGETRRRISVPGYPFQRQSYWFERSARTEEAHTQRLR